jgi:hypothetical protein
MVELLWGERNVTHRKSTKADRLSAVETSPWHVETAYDRIAPGVLQTRDGGGDHAVVRDRRDRLPTCDEAPPELMIVDKESLLRVRAIQR